MGESLFEDQPDEEVESQSDCIFEETPPLESLRMSVLRRSSVNPAWPKRDASVAVNYEAWGKIQQRAVDQVLGLKGSGVKSVVGCGVTGFGKTRVSEMLLSSIDRDGGTAAFWTHRNMLLEQTHRRFEESKIEHGVVASSWPEWDNPEARIQLGMIQSMKARLDRRGKLPEADFVIWDEHHANAKGNARVIFDKYHSAGAFQLGLTATPVNLGHMDQLVYFGRPSEMRAIGAIVRADFASPDAIDVKDVRRIANGEFSASEVAKRVMVTQVAGSIFGHLLEYNPQLRPTLMFAPDVNSSRWLCDQSWSRGIPACSIDGSAVYFGVISGGKRVMFRGEDARRHARELSEEGTIRVVTNRMVFAMGVDWPWIEHLVFATAIGTLPFWIQACGRGLRAYPASGKSRCFIQDHGGNVIHRHPSCNVDIEWCKDDSPKELSERRERDREEGRLKDPMRCPKCSLMTAFEVWSRNGHRCAFCKNQFEKNVIPVWIKGEIKETSAKLKVIPADKFEFKKKKKVNSEAQRQWNKLYFPSKNSRTRGSTFKQLEGRLAHETDWRICEGRAGDVQGKICLFNVKTKEIEAIRGVPKTRNSALWDMQVSEVRPQLLQ